MRPPKPSLLLLEMVELGELVRESPSPSDSPGRRKLLGRKGRWDLGAEPASQWDTHTGTPAQTHTHLHTHTQTDTHTRKQTQARKQTHTRANRPTLAQTDTHTRRASSVSAQTTTEPQSVTNTHTHTHPQGGALTDAQRAEPHRATPHHRLNSTMGRTACGHAALANQRTAGSDTSQRLVVLG